MPSRGKARPVGSTFAALSERGFGRYLSGQFSSSAGTWMQRVAQDWLVLDLTDGSGVAVAVTTSLQFLPYLASPWSGVLADRISRRTILMCSQAVGLLISLGMGVAVATSHAMVLLVYVAALVSGMAAALDGPARLAIIGDIVPSAHLVNGVGLNAMAFNLARIVGPALAGLLIAFTGMMFVFAAIAGLFLLALIVFASLPRTRPQVGIQDRATFRQGIHLLRASPEIAVALAFVFVVSSFGLYFHLTTALISREVFGGGAATFGIMSTLIAVGAMTGALTIGRRPTVNLATVSIAALVFGIVEITAGLMPTLATYGAMLILCGAGALVFSTAAQSFVQLRSPSDVRGRMMGIYTLVFYAGHPVGAPIVGWVSDRLGPRFTLIGAGLCVLAGTAIVTVIWISLGRDRIRGLGPRTGINGSVDRNRRRWEP